MRRTTEATEHEDLERRAAVPEVAGRGAGSAAALGAVAASFVALGTLILARYPLRHWSYPIGWDSAFYVWRSAAVTVDGLARVGTIRAGSPLFVAVLMRVTGQNGFTMVAVAMAVLVSITALGTAAMARAALGVNAVWMVVIGVVSWVAFGHLGMIPGGHLDNVLNAAFVVSGFAAAVAFAGERRGAAAAAVLLAAAALAEWPFYAVAATILVLALALFVAWGYRANGNRWPDDASAVARPLLLALGASALVGAVAILSRPRGRLLHHFSAEGRLVIKERFLQRLRDPARWYALPLAALGGALAARVPVPPRRDPARRLFLSLMIAWISVTLAMAIAQLFDLPVAGGRLLNYVFAIPLLAGVLLWALHRAMRARFGEAGSLLGALMTAAAVVGFGVLAWQGGGVPPSIGPAPVRQASAAGEFAAARPGQDVVFLQGTGRHAWEVLQASLPPEAALRVSRFSDGPAAFEQALSDGSFGTSVAFVLRAYSPTWYREALGLPQWSAVASGVLVRAESSVPPVVERAPPTGNFGPLALAVITGGVALLLLMVGSGWATVLLPADPLVRVLLAPGLGAATITLAAAAWDRVGLGFSTTEAWVLALVTASAGWVLAGWTRRRRSGRRRGQAPSDPAVPTAAS